MLRGLAQISEAARAAGIDVSVCGEMAHDPHYLPFLIGIGIRTLSINPKFLPDVQAFLLGITAREARKHAERLLFANTVKETSAEIARHLASNSS